MRRTTRALVCRVPHARPHERLYIAVQVLPGHEAIDTRVAPLAQGPKGLDTVGVDGTAHICPGLMIDGPVRMHRAPAGTSVIRVHRDVQCHPTVNASLQGAPVRMRYHLDRHRLARPVFQAQHPGLRREALGLQRALAVGMPVLGLAPTNVSSPATGPVHTIPPWVLPPCRR